MNRRVFILGSTGSIGTSTIEVICHLNTLKPNSFEIVGLAANTSKQLLLQQAHSLDAHAISLASGEVDYKKVSNSAVSLLADHAVEGDLVVAAMVGFDGIEPVLKAIEIGCDIALANKECLVAAGELIVNKLAVSQSKMIPIDSEHSAIFQAVGNNEPSTINKIILTASGGSLRDFTDDEVREATVEQVLNHPTWNMGRKVTVDSASLMNKGLELIEAKWLFDLSVEQLDAVIHPQSIVHGLIEFADGSTIAQLSPPSMLFPIQYALTQPLREALPLNTVDWSVAHTLEFHPIDVTRYPSIELSKHVIASGGTSGAILNASNEVAVQAFLDHQISFHQIFNIVEHVLNVTPINNCDSLQTVIESDAEARIAAQSTINSLTETERAL